MNQFLPRAQCRQLQHILVQAVADHTHIKKIDGETDREYMEEMQSNGWLTNDGFLKIRNNVVKEWVS